jgi:hypothetical protein
MIRVICGSELHYLPWQETRFGDLAEVVAPEFVEMVVLSLEVD